ncbi:MAG: hypothetical protein EZS28_052035, partial [Streblomastix strix]
PNRRGALGNRANKLTENTEMLLFLHSSKQTRTIQNKQFIEFIPLFHPALNGNHEIPEIPDVETKFVIRVHTHRRILQGFDLILVGDNDDGQCLPSIGPYRVYAMNWRRAKQAGTPPSIEEVNAFWKEVNFNLSIAYVRMEHDSDEKSQTMKLSKTSKEEF